MKNNWSQDKYIETFRFAAEKHNGQVFPGTDWPYLVHISMVSMEIIAALNHEPDLNGDLALQVAILHDIIEDTDTTYNELQLKFGQKVADGVLSLTKDKSIEKHDQMFDSLRRIKMQSQEIWMVKLADRITNLQPPPSHWNNAKKTKYLKQAGLIYDELNDASDYLSKRLEEKTSIYQGYID
jgi:(p)ppGpp synthase/HD superfamily hydrolase